MRVAWRPAWGYYLLNLKLTRVQWFINLVVGIAIPVVVYVIYAQRLPATARTRVLVGSALFSALMMIARYPASEMIFNRVSGQRDLLATMGLSRNGYLVGMGLYALTLAGMPVAVLAGGLLLTDVPLPASGLWVVPFACAVLSLLAMAYVVAGHVKTLPAAGLIVNLMVAASLALCPLLYPVERVPALIRPAIALLPPTLSAETMTDAWRGVPLVPWHLPLLLAWTAALTLLGWRRFPWTDTE